MTHRLIYRQCQWSCPSIFWSIFLVAKKVSFYLLTCGSELSNWKNWCSFSEILTHTTVGIFHKKEMLFCGWNFLYLEVNGNIHMIIVQMHAKFTHFRINLYNWSYSIFSLEKLHLSWLVTIFYKENVFLISSQVTKGVKLKMV